MEHWREIQTPDSAIAVGLEQEYFVVTSGFHRYFETSITAGYRLPENKFVGVLINNGLLSEGNRRNSSTYVIYRTQCEEFGVVVGLGNFKFDAAGQDGFSAIVSLSKSWGTNLSLF